MSADNVAVVLALIGSLTRGLSFGIGLELFDDLTRVLLGLLRDTRVCDGRLYNLESVHSHTSEWLQIHALWPPMTRVGSDMMSAM